ncbi:ARM repeat-containing protein [Serendipita vermifera]|nr:ARM repeat-containing protein [Serendipita vermifera]
MSRRSGLEVREAALNTLGDLSQHSEVRSEIIQYVSKILACLTDQDWGVQRAALNAFGNLLQHSETWSGIVQHVPTVISCLGDENRGVRTTALNVFENISQHSEMLSESVQHVSKVSACLTDEESDVRQAAMKALGTLSQQTNVRSKIIPHLPGVILCLRDPTLEVQETTLNTIGILVQYPEFVIEIEDLRTIFGFLHHWRDSLVCAAINVTGQIAGYSKQTRNEPLREFKATIHSQIPILMNLLGHVAPDVRATAVTVLCRMAQIGLSTSSSSR